MMVVGVICNLPGITIAGESVPSVDERLARRLDWFQDQKFGLFLHWGIYSQLGCIESWPLVFGSGKKGQVLMFNIVRSRQPNGGSLALCV